MEKPTDYQILFDGGSRGNPGPAYGSYALTRVADGKRELVRLSFDRPMTNNEAEYETVVTALSDLIGRIERAHRSPEEFTVTVEGDSQLVIRQVLGTWKARDERMRAYRDQVRGLLSRFKGYRLKQRPRREIVRVLGH
ncbi:MAG: reverse transcriptase-like protein [Chloroflexi bacterium]|nr:MAG: reverse transcriptase-like protein [Chloroflexota bacterium]